MLFDRSWGISRGREVEFRKPECTPLNSLAHSHRDVDRKTCPSLLRPIWRVHLSVLFGSNVSIYRSSPSYLLFGVDLIGSHLLEANVGALLTEALTADVQAVLADQTGTVGADAAVKRDGMLARLPFSSLNKMPSSNFFSMCVRVRPDGDIIFSSTTGVGVFVPRAGTLSVATRAGVPDGFVRHDVG